MKNNLFFYATKELSQDAFICWLLSYAMKDAQPDEGLRRCAKDFIGQFIGREPTEDLWVTEIQRQYKSIDVLITVNDDTLILIEDKVFTNEHHDQLKRYKDLLEKDFQEKKLICVFWKTGFQSNVSVIRENGYLLFDRERILKTLERYVSYIKNPIFLDYYNYIKELDNEIQKFQTKPISEWDWRQINGFYDYLEKSKIFNPPFQSAYSYVSNPSGGFYGMWFFNNTYKELDGTRFELYVQLELKTQFS